VPFLQECTNPNCNYRIDFDDHVFKALPISTGNCPSCGRVTVVFCPACKQMMETTAYIDRSHVCFMCGTKLTRLCKQRRSELASERRRQRTLTLIGILSPRERIVMKMLAEGHSNKQIASELSISTRTVESYRASLMEKLDLHCIADIVHLAIQEQVVSIAPTP
jgi:DNA-binding CsgD family transcriptional regulator